MVIVNFFFLKSGFCFFRMVVFFKIYRVRKKKLKLVIVGKIKGMVFGVVVGVVRWGVFNG